MIADEDEDDFVAYVLTHVAEAEELRNLTALLTTVDSVDNDASSQAATRVEEIVSVPATTDLVHRRVYTIRL